MNPYLTQDPVWSQSRICREAAERYRQECKVLVEEEQKPKPVKRAPAKAEPRATVGRGEAMAAVRAVLTLEPQSLRAIAEKAGVSRAQASSAIQNLRVAGEVIHPALGCWALKPAA